MDNQQVIDLLKMLWPVLLIQIGVQIYAIVDLLKRKKTKNLNLPIWLAIIVLTEIVGPIVYLLVGRSED